MLSVSCSQQAVVDPLIASCRGINRTVISGISGGPAAGTPETTVGMVVVRGLQDGNHQPPPSTPPKKKPEIEELASPQGYSKQDYSFPSSFQQKPGYHDAHEVFGLKFPSKILPTVSDQGKFCAAVSQTNKSI